MEKAEIINQIKGSLPVRVIVSVQSTDEGLWAKISTPDNSLSNCYTQASNATELVVMVNDAIFTHFEVPEEYRQEIGYYIPLSNEHIRMEEMFNRLVSMEKELDMIGMREETLTLKTAVC